MGVCCCFLSLLLTKTVGSMFVYWVVGKDIMKNFVEIGFGLLKMVILGRVSKELNKMGLNVSLILQ